MEISNYYEHGEVGITLRPLTIKESVIQNIKYILICIKEQNPLARDLGLSDIIDSKGIYKNGYEDKIIKAIELYEDRFRVTEVVMKYQEQGKWLITVRGDIVVN